MKALVYSGPRDVRVKNVTDARIERPTDVLVRITSSSPRYAGDSGPVTTFFFDAT